MSADAAEVRLLWKNVAKRFPLWRFAIDLFFDLSSWRLFGSDITSIMMDNKNVRQAGDALRDASPEALDSLAQIAKVNEQRSSDMFRVIFLTYVSVPLALAAMLSEAAPDFLRSLISDNANGIVILLIGSVIFPVMYFCGNWRAKQIVWTIDLFRANALASLPSKPPTN